MTSLWCRSATEIAGVPKRGEAAVFSQLAHVESLFGMAFNTPIGPRQIMG